MWCWYICKNDVKTCRHCKRIPPPIWLWLWLVTTSWLLMVALIERMEAVRKKKLTGGKWRIAWIARQSNNYSLFFFFIYRMYCYFLTYLINKFLLFFFFSYTDIMMYHKWFILQCITYYIIVTSWSWAIYHDSIVSWVTLSFPTLAHETRIHPEQDSGVSQGTLHTHSHTHSHPGMI